MMSHCQVGRGFPFALWGARVLYLGSVIRSRLSLSAGFLRGAEPDIHSLNRVLWTVIED
jgi:hypothetical protein